MALNNKTPINETDVVSGGAAPGAEGKARPGRKSAARSAARKDAAGKTKPKTKPAHAAETKASIVLKKLNSPKGVTIDTLMEATGWQAHSVRGFLSAVVKKKLGLNLVSETGKDGVRCYRIDNTGKAK